MQAAAVVVVLMLSRLLGLGFEVELPLEADLLGIVDGHVHELGEVLELALHVGVPEGLIAFAAAPERVAMAAKLLGDLQGLLHLRRGEGERIGVGTSGGAVDVAGIAEQIGRPPEQLDAGPLHLFLDDLDYGVEVLVALGQRGAFGGDVAIVEAEERGRQFLHELEGHADPFLGHRHIVAATLPGPEHGAGAKRVGTTAAHGVPVSDTEAEMIFHGLAGHDLGFVVVTERQRVF